METQYWLHRISYEWDVSSRLLNHGYLSIGWGDLARKDIPKTVKEDDKTTFDSAMREAFGELRRGRSGLWNFCKFAPGDIVVVPLFEGKFSIYKVTGEPISVIDLPPADCPDGTRLGEDHLIYRANEPNRVDLGFVVKAEAIATNLSRYHNASSRLSARMKMRQTNGNIGNIRQYVDEARNGYTISNFHSDARSALAKVLLDEISRLGDRQLEQLIAWYFKKLEADNVDLPAKGEHGKENGADADVVATFEDLKTIYYVQAKRHDGKTNEWAVKQINSYKEQKDEVIEEYATIPWVISTCESFNEIAVTMAKTNRVRLLNGILFAEALLDAGLSRLNEAFPAETKK
jgi:hypothetical protein